MMPTNVFLGWFRKIMTGTTLAALIIVRRVFFLSLVT
jgi:hypothetical protein